MRIQLPNNPDAARFSNHNNRLDSLIPRDPVFNFGVSPATAQQFTIEPEWLQSGATGLLVPFRRASGTGTLPELIFSDQTFTIDLTATGEGGRLDGIALATNTDYPVWMFRNPAPRGELAFVGITQRPRVTGITMPNPSALGGTVVITVGTNQGNRFAVGSRVVCRNGTTGEVNGAAGSLWNQGYVTATAADTITVALDASWGLSVNNNTAMNGTSSVEIFQLDRFEPRVGGESATYNGGQPYTYLGLARTDSSSELDWVRKRGEPYPLLGSFDAIVRTGITASESFQVGLGRYVPLGTRQIYLTTFTALTAGTPGNATLNISASGSVPNQSSTRSVVSAGAFADDLITIRTRDASLHGSYVESGTITASWILRLAGYLEENW